MNHDRLKRNMTAAAVAVALSLCAGGPAATAATAAPNPPAAKMARPAALDARATRLIGTAVRDAAGERLGDIADLVVDLDNGKVRYAILSFGGFMGLGDRHFAYPLRAFKLRAGADQLVLDVDRDMLRSAPGFDANRWPDWNGTYFETVDRFFGRDDTTAYGRRLWRASDLIGEDVRGRQGSNIGHVADLMVDLRDGAVRYAFVEIDRWARMVDRQVAVPIQHLRARGGNLVLDMNRDQVARLADVRDAHGALAPERGNMSSGPGWTVSSTERNPAGTTAADYVFDRLDVNHDNRLTRNEIAHSPRVMESSRHLDRDGDGVLTREEFARYRR